ncbi:MAG: divalent-cation tolerance protein CutA [Actinomycetota bacterium]|nr:divalent-cation tolerance protein CutA [Actinomycetota bacterium]
MSVVTCHTGQSRGSGVSVEFVQVVTTTESEQEAEKLASSLVEARLAACVQVVGPIRSTYWWKGAVERAQEWLCIAKTPLGRYDEVEAHIRQNHSYEVPEITALPVVDGSTDYLTWIKAETRRGD